MQFLIGTWIAGHWGRWKYRLGMSLTFGFLLLVCCWRRVSWRRIWIFSTSWNFPFSTIFLYFFVTLLWNSCFQLSKEYFSSFLGLFRLTGIGICSPLSLFSLSCTWLDISLKPLTMMKIFGVVQYRILMGLLNILKHRYFIHDYLSSFPISGKNWKRKGGMDWSMMKGRIHRIQP